MYIYHNNRRYIYIQFVYRYTRHHCSISGIMSIIYIIIKAQSEAQSAVVAVHHTTHTSKTLTRYSSFQYKTKIQSCPYTFASGFSLPFIHTTQSNSFAIPMENPVCMS